MLPEAKMAKKPLKEALVIACVSVGLFALGNLLAALAELFFVVVPDGVFDFLFSFFNTFPIFGILFTIPISIIGFIWTWLPALLISAGLCLAELIAAALMIVCAVLFAKRKSRFGTTASALMSVAMAVKVLFDIGEFLIIYVLKPLITSLLPLVILLIGNAAM